MQLKTALIAKSSFGAQGRSWFISVKGFSKNVLD
jgi:hypothetical protein